MKLYYSGWQLHNNLDADSKWKYTKRTVLGFYHGILNKEEYIRICNKQGLYVILWLTALLMCLYMWFRSII